MYLFYLDKPHAVFEIDVWKSIIFGHSSCTCVFVLLVSFTIFYFYKLFLGELMIAKVNLQATYYININE